MKKVLFFARFFFLSILLGILPFYGKAQKGDSTQQYQTLFGDNMSYGGYGALSLGYTKIGDNDAFVSGVKGAWIVGHSIGIGFEGAGFISELTTGIDGGFLIEPIFFALKPIHFAVPIVFGGGAVAFESSNYYNQDYMYNNYHTDYDQFYMIQPGIEVELNITRFFRLAMGGNYRFTSDISLTTTDFNSPINNSDDEIIQLLDNNDLNSYSVYLSFKFGKF